MKEGRGEKRGMGTEGGHNQGARVMKDLSGGESGIGL